MRTAEMEEVFKKTTGACRVYVGKDGMACALINLVDHRERTNPMLRTDALTAYQEMSFARMKAAVAASPPITIVCNALRKGFDPV